MTEKLDTKVIAKLAEILDKTNLSELEYEDEGCRICLTRQILASTPTVAPVYAAPVTQAPTTAPVITVENKTPVVEDFANNPNVVKSPMVGVVYFSADPSTPNYVKEGDHVEAGATICLIEAMKTFNPVKAPKAGKVVKILISTGSPVEYGEPLIVIE